MPVFMDPLTELTAFLVITVLAVPAFIILCLMIEETPVYKPKDTMEDVPFLCGVCALSDVLTPATSSLVCFFVLVLTLFFFFGTASLWFMVWRGCVTANMGGAKLEDTVDVWNNMLQLSAHGHAHAHAHRDVTFAWEQRDTDTAARPHWALAGSAAATMAGVMDPSQPQGTFSSFVRGAGLPAPNVFEAAAEAHDFTGRNMPIQDSEKLANSAAGGGAHASLRRRFHRAGGP